MPPAASRSTPSTSTTRTAPALRGGASLASRDLSALLTAIYALDLDESAQVRALREVWSRPSLGGELATVFTHRACPAQVSVMEHLATAQPELASIARQSDAAMSRELKLRVLRGRPLHGLASTIWGSSRAMQVSRQLGIPEFHGILAPTNTGFAIGVGTPMPANATTSAARAHALRHSAEHLAAAWRLRKRLSASDAFEQNAEGLFLPNGRIADASASAGSKSARERLRELVLMRERALRTPDRGLWPALLGGRYTVVDRFERGGQRYVVAYRNGRSATSLARLSSQERDVVEATCAGTLAKVLALEMGVSQATVSRVLHGALRKLGLASAIELTLLASSSSIVTLDDEVLGAQIITAFTLRGPRADALLALTAAERAVTADLLRGMSNREIAANRNRSVRTVANQVANILQKLKVPTRRALAAKLSP